MQFRYSEEPPDSRNEKDRGRKRGEKLLRFDLSNVIPILQGATGFTKKNS